MKRAYEIICYIIVVVIGVLLICSILAGCSSLKPYKKVANDTQRNEAKRNLLAPVCATEFPVKKSTDSVVVIEYQTIVDTTKESYLKATIKQLLKQLQQRPECPQINEDSLFDAVKSSIKPDVVTKTVTTKIKETVLDSAAMKVAQIKYDELAIAFQKSEANFYKANTRVKQLEDGTKSNIQLGKWFLKHNWWWLLILIGLFIGYQLLKSKISLPFKL